MVFPTARVGSGKRWMARYVDEQGRENTKSFDKQKAAQAWLNEITAAQVTGTYVAPKAGRVSVGDLHAKWLGTQGHLKETTVATRAYTWTSHVEPRWWDRCRCGRRANLGCAILGARHGDGGCWTCNRRERPQASARQILGVGRRGPAFVAQSVR